MAVDYAVDHVVSAMLISLPQSLESAQRTFYYLTVIEAVVGISGGVTYDDIVELMQRILRAQEPTVAIGHPLPQLHANQGGHGFYITCEDVSKVTHTNGSSSCPAAITWAGRYVTPKHKPCAPRERDGAPEVTKRVYTAIGIVSSGGARARTPFCFIQSKRSGGLPTGFTLGMANLVFSNWQ